MKAVIKGITVTGTPEEIMALVRMHERGTDPITSMVEEANDIAVRKLQRPLQTSGYTKPQMTINYVKRVGKY